MLDQEPISLGARADDSFKPAAIDVERIRCHACLPGRQLSSRADTLNGEVETLQMRRERWKA